MGVEDERLETARVGVMEGGGCTGDLLPHVALHKGQQLRYEVCEVHYNGVHGHELEVRIGVGLWVVMGTDGAGGGGVIRVLAVAELAQLLLDQVDGGRVAGGGGSRVC